MIYENFFYATWPVVYPTEAESVGVRAWCVVEI